jgi:hypothetical protein
LRRDWLTGRLIWRLRTNHWRGIANPAQALQRLRDVTSASAARGDACLSSRGAGTSQLGPGLAPGLFGGRRRGDGDLSAAGRDGSAKAVMGCLCRMFREEPSCAFMCFSKRSPHLTIWKNPLRVPETPPPLEPGRGSRFRESHAVRRNRMQRPAQGAGVIHDSLSWRGGGAGL